MKNLKTYENWFTDIFKSHDTDMFDDFLDDRMEEMGYTRLMKYVSEGNLKKIKMALPLYIKTINNTYIQYLDSGSQYEESALTIAASSGKASIPDRKEIIKLLIDNGANMFLEIEEQTFYDVAIPEIKKWIEETYPDFAEELNFKRSSEKYNL